MKKEGPPPARPLYDLVIKETALKGWTKTELSDRSGVARTTIDNWNHNPRKPSAKAVNAVADALGIDRGQAHVLAGIVASNGHGQPDLLPPGMREEIEEGIPDPELRARFIALAEAYARGEPLQFRKRRAAGR